ncbi:MAG: anti-sigma factor family protein, partial [Planctomycetota bacterium]
MGCKQWNDEWVAHLYGELSESETRDVERHLAECAACRETMDNLAASRRTLHESAPAVPMAPRVLVLQPRPVRRPLFAFASGVTCAAALLAVGVVAGASIWSPPAALGDDVQMASQSEPTQTRLTPAELERALVAVEQFEHRLAGLEAGYGEQPQRVYLTRQQMETALESLGR